MEATTDMQIIESKTLSIWRTKASSIIMCLLFIKYIVMVSQALDTLTSMSATAKLQTKKYMGECKFLFLTIAHITKMFSRRLMMPRVRNTSAAMTTCSHGDDLLLTVGTVKLLPKALRFSSETSSWEDMFISGSKHGLFFLRDLPRSVANTFSKKTLPKKMQHDNNRQKLTKKCFSI